MKFFAQVIVVILLANGCSKSDNPIGEFRDITIRIQVNNVLQFDLLDPLVKNTLNSSNIKLFYINNGIIEEPYNPDLLYPRNFTIEKENSNYLMKLFPTDREDVEYPIVVIHWSELDTDTLKCHYKVTHIDNNTQMYCDSVWYNNKLEYPTNNEFKPRRMFKIIK